MRFVLSETFNFRAASRNVFQGGDCFDASEVNPRLSLCSGQAPSSPARATFRWALPRGPEQAREFHAKEFYSPRLDSSSWELESFHRCLVRSDSRPLQFRFHVSE